MSIVNFVRFTVGLFTGLLILAGAFPALGQGFMVQPMRMEAMPRPGETVTIPLRISNTLTAGAQTIELRLIELTQTPQGNWQAIDPQGPRQVSHGASAREWISLESDSVEVPAASGAEVDVTIAAPRTASGAYFAALLVEMPERPDATGLVVRVRFLVPIIVHIQGRPARQQVALQDVTMNYVADAELEQERTTLGHLHVNNAGRTYSRVEGFLTVERQSGEDWRHVTRLEVPERGIMPGVTLELGDDLERRLPSGTYRLRGDLRVDGRRTRALEKEIAFEGDPDIDSLAYDTALRLSPELVALEVMPGAARTAALSIENPGEDPVRVRVGAGLPSDLSGVALGEIRGDALSAVPWTDIRPAEFTLRPRARQNVRIISRVPRDGVDHANYYADLVLQGTYPDGQSAGETRSLIHLKHQEHEDAPEAVIERLLVSEGEEGSEYIFQARLVNIGNVHLEPTAKVQLLNVQGIIMEETLDAEPEPILPLGSQLFSGAFDLSEVEPGQYIARTVAAYEEGRAQSQLLIEVRAGEQGAARQITVLEEGADIELPDADPVAVPG